MKRIIFTLLIAALIVPFLPLVVKDADAVAIAPPKFEYNVQPGDMIQDDIVIMNHEEYSIPIGISLINLGPSQDEAGSPTFVDDENDPFGLIQWITTLTGDHEVPARGQYSYPFVMEIPLDAQPGAHYGAICIGEKSDIIINEDIGPSVIGDVCTIVLANVDGDISVDGDVIEFSASEFSSSLPVDFIARFKNDGTVFLKPQGNIIIKNWLGNKVAEVKVNEGLLNVTPGSVRKFEVVWQNNELDEDTAEIMKELKNFAFGPYTAELMLSYGYEEVQSKTVITRFWVLPWQLMLLGLIILIVLYGLLMLYNRGVVNSAMKKRQ